MVVDKGRVVEMGKHDELVTRRGAYEALVRRQLVGAGPEAALQNTKTLMQLNPHSERV